MLHLHLLLLARVDSLHVVRVVRVEVVPGGDLLRHRHGRGGEDLLLLHSLLLLLLEQLLLLHALATGENFAQAPTDIFELEVGAGDGACVLLVAFLLSVDALVIGEVDVVDIFLILCLCCHLMSAVTIVFLFELLRVSSKLCFTNIFTNFEF